MQIVIDIPDEVVENETYAQYLGCMSAKLDEVIYEGTILPKGHGRLIDADELKTHFVGTEQGTDLEVYLESTIIDARTIIEADKSDEREK